MAGGARAHWLEWLVEVRSMVATGRKPDRGKVKCRIILCVVYPSTEDRGIDRIRVLSGTLAEALEFPSKPPSNRLPTRRPAAWIGVWIATLATAAIVTLVNPFGQHGTGAIYIATGGFTTAPLFKPSCPPPADCSLSGDSTYIIQDMTWSVWSSTEAVGSGTAVLDDCNPSCADGHIYHVPVVLTFSHPVKDCAAGGTRYFWSQVHDSYPSGLPAVFSGAYAPANPWVFTLLIGQAKQDCGS
jgi:hypothetical protein